MPQEDAWAFVQLFGRFEHALKRSVHLKKGRTDAQADWVSFAKALGPQFFEEIVSAGVANTLINDPPRKLMSDGLDWQRKPASRLTTVVEVFVHGVCRVRNSYVHGEKFRAEAKQRERDGALVREALAVLRLAQEKGLVDLA